jgi:hypothetical protein
MMLLQAITRLHAPASPAGSPAARLSATTSGAFGINPNGVGSKDLKKIASGLNNILDGTTFKGTRRTGRIAAPKSTLSNTQVGHVTYAS